MARSLDPTCVDLERGYCEGMTDALRRLRNGARRAPGPDDRPPPSTFPITRAARAALRYDRQPWGAS